MSRYRYRYRHRQAIGLVSLLLAIALTVAQQQGWLSDTAKSVEINQPNSYSINHYVDGDTIAVNMDGHSETIRFIGIDTPETHKPDTPVQCYGPAAAAHTKNTIVANGGRVRLVADPLSTNRDRYGRLLRYVYLLNGTDLNELNVQQGYAFYYPYFPFSKKAQFAADQRTAQAKKLGLWGNCSPTPSDDGGYKMEQLANPQT